MSGRGALTGGWLSRVLVLVCVALTGCTLNPPEADQHSQVQMLVQRYVNRAVSYEEQGQVARALGAWWTVVALQPTATDASAQITRLAQQVEEDMARHLPALRSARIAGNDRAVRRRALAILLLDPEQPQARQALRDVERKAARERMLQRAAAGYELLREQAPPR